MFKVRRKTIDITVAVFVGLIPIVLLVAVFPGQVPSSAEDDISARIYPDTLAYLWIALSILHLGEVWLKADDNTVEISRDSMGYQAGLLLTVLVGYLLLLKVGYLIGAAFYVLTFTWMMRERGPAAWSLAIITPFAVYFIMETAFEVRLPTFPDSLLD